MWENGPDSPWIDLALGTKSSDSRASFKKNSIPTAGLFDVVEHIEKDVDFLKAIHEIIMENGFVFITDPAFNVLWSNEDDDAGHFRRYTIKELEDKLKSVGFIIEYATYIFSVLTIAVFLFRSLPSKLGLNKNSHTFDKHEKAHENKKGVIDKMLNRIWKYEIKKSGKERKFPLAEAVL